MKSALILSGFAALAAAFPRVMNNPRALETAAEIQERVRARWDNSKERSFDLARRQNDPLGISAAQTNCGPTPCLTFDPEDQLISVTGQNVYQSPAVSDIRGPCPGLNAAANHGYLPRNGIVSIEQTISGLGALYNMSPDLALALAAYAVAIDGNVSELVWSIGGPLPADYLGAGVLGTGQGLSYSHNNYEGDGSIGRNDAYINNGDAHSLNISKFEAVYAVGGDDDRYTLDRFRQRLENVQLESIATNPYYFTGLFSTIVVVPAAYNFVINFMSNHSAEEPSGYLDGYNFKSFFGVSGEPGSFVWNRGQEQVPENWYRRPSSNQYDLFDVVDDVAVTYLAYPNTLRIGGNLGQVNSFAGVDVSNLTGGVFNLANLFEGNNFGCFAFNLLEQALPDFLKPTVGDISPALDLVANALSPILSSLECPELAQFDQGLFNQYPGRQYSPTGPDTNYKN